MLPPPLPPGVGGAPRLEPAGPLARARVFVRDHRKLSVGGGVALALLVVYPFAVGALAAHLCESRLSSKLGRAVTVGHGRGGLGRIVLEDLTIPGAAGGPPLATISRLTIPFGVVLGMRSAIEVEGLRVHAVRGGDDDNLDAVLEKVRGRHAGEAAKPESTKPDSAKRETAKREAQAESTGPSSNRSSGRSLPDVVFHDAAIEARDTEKHLQLSIAGLDGELRPGVRLALRMRGVKGGLVLGGEGEGPHFGADELDIETPLDGLKPSGIPSLRVAGGHATPLPQLSLTGIAGVIGPPPSGVVAPGAGMVIDLRGSYGGAREALWTAKGHADPAHGTGKLALRAEQFSLGRIAEVLPPSVLKPENTTLDAALDLDWAGDAVSFGGELAMVGLSLQSDALAADPVENVSVGVTLRGTVYPLARRLELELAEARVRDVTARLSGHVALPAGTFKFTNGKTLSVVPDIDLHFSVPRVACSKLLSSIPPALVPRLQGFVLQGFFAADVGFKADFANLDDLDLTGKVGIDGCKVVKAPDDVKALANPETLVINVEVPKLPGSGGQPGDTDTIPVVVGPDNPDFTPYDQISPYLVGSIMTTEDNGFFKHHGWVSSEFKSALRKNLKGGGFRLGASSITMQMTKNVLLTKDKTLSRKLQELFLVWYLEQILPKERILELYFNAIEFGPRIYGIGAATRHYFGKKPSELTPLEAAFFSSILPSPKRRYVQYCHGALSAQWDRYVRRILAKVHERGRITDDEYATAAAQPFVFDRQEATFTEKQCLEWVKSMAPKPEPETPPDLEEGESDSDGGGWSSKRLKKLFSHPAAHRTPTATATKAVAARSH
ncbi:MAG TPA: biosynthetic peptidoglycan transglycosylase [Polyangia bacterium]|nr:biosynthetic peptidoglycan transglycosylase [Polyangia bacterium]